MLTIKQLKISNFKSFNQQPVELGNFNVLIGANASGKSNFVQVFRFLRDIVQHGLDNAMSMQGGVEYLRNAKFGKVKELGLKIMVATEFSHQFLTPPQKRIQVTASEMSYEMTLGFNKRDEFKISQERVDLTLQVSELFPAGPDELNGQNSRHLGEGNEIRACVGWSERSEFRTQPRFWGERRLRYLFNFRGVI